MAASNTQTGEEADIHEVWTVLPNHMGGGPHGLGDPNDTSLRKVEAEIIIPQRMRDKAKEKCASEVEEFTKCGKKMGFLLPLRCRKENTAMQNCMVSWYDNKEFKDAMTKEYLAERAHYRSTGTPLKRYRRKQEKKSS